MGQIYSGDFAKIVAFSEYMNFRAVKPGPKLINVGYRFIPESRVATLDVYFVPICRSIST
jgi:hypothetical protein